FLSLLELGLVCRPRACCSNDAERERNPSDYQSRQAPPTTADARSPPPSPSARARQPLCHAITYRTVSCRFSYGIAAPARTRKAPEMGSTAALSVPPSAAVTSISVAPRAAMPL